MTSAPLPDRWSQFDAALRDLVASAQVVRDQGDPSPRSGLAMLREIVARRRLRARFFDAGLFGDPAWDMLLTLAIAERAEQLECVTGLSLATAVPPTTGLRWQTVLLELGLMQREPDPYDARRSWVRLTRRGRDAMDGYLAAVATR